MIKCSRFESLKEHTLLHWKFPACPNETYGSAGRRVPCWIFTFYVEALPLTEGKGRFQKSPFGTLFTLRSRETLKARPAHFHSVSSEKCCRLTLFSIDVL